MNFFSVELRRKLKCEIEEEEEDGEEAEEQR